MKKNKLRLIILILAVLLISSTLIYYGFVKFGSKEEANNENSVLTCKYSAPISTESGSDGTETFEYEFSFKGEVFTKYILKNTIEYNSKEDFNSYCTSCSEEYANETMNNVKGIKVNLSTAENKYTYETVEIDVLKYDGDNKNGYVYSLKPYNTQMTKEDIIDATKDMSCETK